MSASITARVLACIVDAGDAGRMPSDVCRALGLTGEQVRRIGSKLHAAGRLHRAPEPGATASRYFGTEASAAKWRRLYPTGLSDAESRGVGIQLGRRAGTVKAKAAGMAAPVTLPADFRRVVKDGQPIYTGNERRTVAQHRPDPRYYVDPDTMPRHFSALPPGQYPDGGRV